MALDFDVDHEPSFPELVGDARRDVMKGRAMSVCWSELVDQHAFFKDIAKEGCKRGEVLGAVLASLQGISAAVQRAEEAGAAATAAGPASSTTTASASQPPHPNPAMCDAGLVTPRCEARLLTCVAQAYMRLYATTPVPTRAQWVAALQPLLSVPNASEGASGRSCDGAAPCSSATRSRSAEEAEAGDDARSSVPPTLTALGRYIANLRGRVQDVAAEVCGADSDGEDGSFAEEELKELVRCCMAAGRRVARPTVLPTVEARRVREMVKVLQDYVGSATLEW